MKLHTKKYSFLVIATFILVVLSLLFYFDYKKNPITYIILSKKFEIVYYLFSRDWPAIYPSNNYYEISYERINDGSKDGFKKSLGSITIYKHHDIYATGLPQKLRMFFDDYSKLNPNKKADRKIIEDIVGTNNAKGRLLSLSLGFKDVAKYDEDLQNRIKEYIKLFSKKFIVTSITEYEDDEQCGKKSYDIGIIIDSNPTEDLTIGLTNSGKICFIWDENFMLYKHEVRSIKEAKEYKDYWL